MARRRREETFEDFFETLENSIAAILTP